jgi:hypothetical protein
MHDLFLALSFVAIVLSPCIVALRVSNDFPEDD